MQPAAKKSKSKSTVGGRKWAGRTLDEDGYASEEILVIADSEEEGMAELERLQARPLQVPLVTNGQINAEAWGPDALVAAQKRHIHSRNELPYQAWRLSEGEVAIPTRYVEV